MTRKKERDGANKRTREYLRERERENPNRHKIMRRTHTHTHTLKNKIEFI
jgi:hypothetical protein